ncbi:type II toxin-antitoxin system RelE/ParE family toxin [Streptomyces sp. JJ66]|uniref:type II toxin-antitoxin system RelE family toxin n=1 Tax=Streptomyces sp. JJ66 TaxID=2803843 RepID=UPI001C55A9FB|nr:type II toxin-antitoxin system RelE/ParE family toxin [Streptomyces sp. JJ66]MBW1603721.1 type II toxin-antitoxin system RelE/ParE family toxin [Streptomyces sp. JJ66]
MKYQIRFTQRARNQLRGISKTVAMRILRKLTELLDDPYGLDTTALVGSEADERRLRVGDYRVVYTVDDGRLVVQVVRVGHRSEVYRGR